MHPTIHTLTCPIFLPRCPPLGVRIECDKPKVAAVLDVMLRAKIDDLFARGCWFEARYFESLSKHFCRALESAITAVRAARQALLRPGGRSGGGDRGRRASLFSTASVLFNQSSVEPVGDDGGGCSGVRGNGSRKVGGVRVYYGVGGGEGMQSVSALSALKARLRWRGAGEAAGCGGGVTAGVEGRWMKQTGTSLLAWAVLCDDADAVEEALLVGGRGGSFQEMVGGARKKERKKELSRLLQRGLPKKVPALTLVAKMAPLHMAMAFAGPAVVELLLAAGASPTACTGTGYDPLQMAAIFGSVENIKLWLRWHPSWNLERVDKQLGNTCLVWGAASGGGKSLAVMELFLKAGASADAVNALGGNLLHCAVINPDLTSEDMRALLLLPQLRDEVPRLLRMPLVPRTCKWKIVFKVRSQNVCWWEQGGIVLTDVHNAY